MEFHLQSKVWVYQSNRLFTEADLAYLHHTLKAFTASWQAHNQQLKAGYEIKYNLFIVLIVDETQAGASGCSIDKSVHLMKEIEEQLHIKLFDRFLTAYKDQDEIKTADRAAFEKLISAGNVNSDTIVFNNLVKNYQEYTENWETPFHKSWHAKVFSLPEKV